MAKLSVRCPRCGAAYQVDESLAGKKARCKKADCGTTFPLAETVPAQPTDIPTLEPVAATPTVGAWRPGDVLFDLYEVQGLLGEGGMGRVYRVRHRGWDVDLAVKVPRPELLAQAGAVDNFVTEAETWVNLGLHPHVVSCYYVRRLDTLPLVFAEFVAGGSLKDAVETGRLYEGGPDVALARIVDVAVQFAWGLHFAHEHGLVHQDVKPANVLLTPDGTAKVTDFGLARAQALTTSVAAAPGLSVLVSAGGMTPAYCSPEQAGRQKLTRKTDLWSWAVSVLELFTGEVSWPSGTVAAEALEAYLEAGPPDDRVPPMPAGLADLLRECFREDPRDRPGSALELADRLQALSRQVCGEPYPRPAPSASTNTADSLNNRALSLLDLHKGAEAEAAWQAALAADPLHLDATFNLGLRRWRAAEITDDELLRRLQRAVAAAPDAWPSRQALALVHLERGDAGAALAALRELPDADRARLEIAGLLGKAQASLSTSPAGGGVNALLVGPAAARVDTDAQDQGAGVNLPVLRGAQVRSAGKVLWAGWNAAGDHVLLVNTWKESLPRAPLPASGRTRRVIAQMTGLAGDGEPREREHVAVSLFSVTGKKVAQVDLEVAAGRAQAAPVAQSRERTTLALGLHAPASVVLVEAPRCKVVATLPAPCSGLLDLGDGPTLAVAAGGEVHVGTAVPNGWRHHTAWPGEKPTAIQLGPGGATLAAGSAGGKLARFDLATGSPLAAWPAHGDRVTDLRWAPDGRSFTSAGADGLLHVWPADGTTPLATGRGHSGPVSHVGWRDDGRYLVSAGKDRTVRLWDPATGRCLRTFTEHLHPLRCAQFSPDGQSVLSAEEGERAQGVKVWPVAPDPGGLAAPYLLSRIVTSEALTAYQTCLAEAEQARGRGDAVGELRHLRAARALPGYARDRRVLAAWSALSNRLGRSSFEAGWEEQTLRGHDGPVNAVAFSADGRVLFSGGADGTVRLWDADDGACRQTLRGHEGAVLAVRPRPRGRHACSAGADRVVRLWDLGTGQCLRRFGGHANYVRSLSVSRCGRFLLSAAEDKTVRLWEVNTGWCVWALGGRDSSDWVNRMMSQHTQGVAAAVLSRDLRHLLTAGWDGELKWWDFARRDCLWHDRAHEFRALAADLAEDGLLAASAGGDGAVKVWLTASGKCLRTFRGHAGAVNAVALSADRRFVLSAGKDGTVRLWDVSGARCLGVWAGHTGEVTAASLARDGQVAATAGADGTVKLWRLAYELEGNAPADWHEGARPYLTAFLSGHTPFAAELPATTNPRPEEITAALTRSGAPVWTPDDWQELLETLGHAGFGWLRPEGVWRELSQMAATWAGPPDHAHN